MSLFSCDQHTLNILAEVAGERARQVAKWGRQDIPSVDAALSARDGGCEAERMASEYEIPGEHRAKFLCENAFAMARGTFAHIAIEEVSEAVCAPDDQARRAELVQCAAVFVAWIEAIDRRAAARALDSVSMEPPAQVGCEGVDGFLRIHDEDKVCDVCGPAPPGQPLSFKRHD